MRRTRASAVRGPRSRPERPRSPGSALAAAVRPRPTSRPLLHDQDADQPRLRRRGHHGRPGGVPGRPQGAQARRQRGRRRRRHGRRARRDRALQLRHRRRRLLRLLRREDRQGAHDRRPRDRAAAMPHDAFIDPATGKPYHFTPELVTSGVSVGVPGTPATWASALRALGHATARRRRSRPRPRLARRGFVVDQTFRQQTAGQPGALRGLHRRPASCSCPAATPRPSARSSATPTWPTPTDALGRKGIDGFYRGPLGRRDRPHRAGTRRRRPTTDLPVPAGLHDARDLARYRAVRRAPTHVGYRGYDVYGMAPSSSGGTTVGEALNILEHVRPRRS